MIRNLGPVALDIHMEYDDIRTSHVIYVSAEIATMMFCRRCVRTNKSREDEGPIPKSE